MIVNLSPFWTSKVLAHEILIHERPVSVCRLQKGFLGRQVTTSVVPRGLGHTEGVRYLKLFSRSTLGAGGGGRGQSLRGREYHASQIGLCPELLRSHCRVSTRELM